MRWFRETAAGTLSRARGSSGQVDLDAGDGDAGLAAVVLTGCGQRSRRAGTGPQVGQHQAPGAGVGGLLTRLACAGDVAARVVGNLIDEGCLGQEQVAVTGQFAQFRARAAVTGVGQDPAARGQAQARVGYPVRQQAGLGAERADVQAAARAELVQREGAGQHLGAIQRQDRIQCAGQRMHRQWRRWVSAQCTGPQQRAQVGAVIRVPVADEYSVDLLSGCPLQEPRHRRIAKIDQQPETIVLHQEATARLARLRPRAAPAKNREPHTRHPNDQSADNPRAEQATEPSARAYRANPRLRTPAQAEHRPGGLDGGSGAWERPGGHRRFRSGTRGVLVTMEWDLHASVHGAGPPLGQRDWHDAGVPDASDGRPRVGGQARRGEVADDVPECCLRSERMGAIFEHPVDVRWRDTDALGHVNHAVFLTYLEEGRDAFFSQTIGSDPIYVVARLEVDLRAEVRHPDRRVTVRIEVERLGTTSLTTRETVLTSSKDVAAQGRVVTVRWDPGHRKPIPFSEAERTRLAAAMTG